MMMVGMLRSRTRSVAGSKRASRLEFNNEPMQKKERHYSIDFSHDVYTLNPAVDEGHLDFRFSLQH